MPRYEPPHTPGDNSYGDPYPGPYPGAAPAGAPAGSAWPADERYAAPADPWQTDTGPPDWASGEPRPPQRPTGVRRLLVVLAVALLVCGAASVTGYLLLRDEPTAATGAPSPDPATPPQTSPTGGTPLPRSSTDVRFIVVGQCVRNEGGNDDPKLTIIPCGPRTYQVLERFDGPTTGKDDARSKCAAVPGYTDWYFFDSPLDVLDYVLCLRSR